jgi:hypothetical protein
MRGNRCKASRTAVGDVALFNFWNFHTTTYSLFSCPKQYLSLPLQNHHVMKTVTIQMKDEAAKIWQTLPIEAQAILTSGALSALLAGELYPTGTDQLELAISLAEKGVPADMISRLTRLDKDVFESFLSK